MRSQVGFDVVVVGGCGHAGLPLGLAFADRGLRVALYDIDEAKVSALRDGRLPFRVPMADEILARVLAAGQLRVTSDPAVIADSENVVVVIGTPVDDQLSPDPGLVPRELEPLATHFRGGQLLVLRSTLYPGVTALVEKLVARLGLDLDIAVCPERIAEGRALVELFELPEIVGARRPRAAERAERLFRRLTDEVIHLSPEEAELAKLFTNSWRYLKFAMANQLYMIANDFGLDYERIRAAMALDYPRAADLPGAGFSAGPCLLKDTMQLAASYNNNFVLGHASMMVNEGLPQYLISRLERRFDLAGMTVGILGMSFKAESDDVRDSLSYRLRRLLKVKAADVLCTDPYVSDPELLPLDEVLARSDLLVVAAPHAAYADIRTKLPVVDIWNLLGRGVRV